MSASATVASDDPMSCGKFFGSMGCIEGSKDAEEERLKKDANKKIEKQIQKDKQIYRATHRLLLLGNDDVISQPTHFSANFEICASDKARVPFPRQEHVARLFWASLVVLTALVDSMGYLQ